MIDKKNTDAARRFASAFAESLTEAIDRSLGIQRRFSVQDSVSSAARVEQSLHFKLQLGGGLRGQSFILFTESQVAAIVSKTPGQPNVPSTDEHGETLRKLISSAMSAVSASLSALYGPFSFEVDLVKESVTDGMESISFAVIEAEPSDTAVTLCFDDELLQALSSEKSADKTEIPRIDPVNLKLVMDVELNVSLRFGQRQMPLREVLELVSGSVVELDRQVDEPVELLLDGKVIARGEAVIVDGNYGLRVTEIPQPIASYLVH